MKLVVDTNILVSFFRQNPVSNFISKSKSLNMQLFSSEYIIKELKKNKSDIFKYAGLNLKQFNKRLSELLRFIEIISEKSCEEFKQEAKQLAPHDKDAPIFALALKLNCPVWSNEPSFKQQSKITVLSTKDMIELFA